jgi:hypothetical protein
MQGSIEVYKIKSDKKTKMRLSDLEDKMDRDLKKRFDKRHKWNLKQSRKLRKKGCYLG